jgi:uncharacterized protein YegL
MRVFLTLLASLVLYAGNDYIVVDLSRGISKKEFNELGRLTQPKKKAEDSIYKNGDNSYLLAFNSTSVINREFKYSEIYKNESNWKDAFIAHRKFFKSIKPAIKIKKELIRANIIFLVDTSGSMIKNDLIGDVKDTMHYLIDAKSKRAQVSIVTFDGKKGMSDDKKSKTLLKYEEDKTKLHSIVDKIKASHYDTFLGSGLKKVKRLLSSSPKEKTVVMIFTDGKEIDDYKLALTMINKFKVQNINVKVVAVGGADVDMLRKFSSSGFVYNATAGDLRGIVKDISINNDDIFLRVNSFMQNSPKPTKKDKFIFYSSMINVDNSSDFNIVPNIASKEFYDEVMKHNKANSLDFNFNGARVFVRLTGKMSAEYVNKLRIFWSRFFKDHGAKLEFFGNTNLSKNKL